MKEIIESMAMMNMYSFGAEDEYSTVNDILNHIHMKEGEYLIEKSHDITVGYYLYKEHDTHIEGVRTAVIPCCRQQGICLKMLKKLIKLASDNGKSFKTYTSIDNPASMGVHLKAGMVVKDISDGWVNMVTK